MKDNRTRKLNNTGELVLFLLFFLPVFAYFRLYSDFAYWLILFLSMIGASLISKVVKYVFSFLI